MIRYTFILFCSLAVFSCNTGNNSAGEKNSSAGVEKPGDVAIALYSGLTSGDADMVKQNIHFEDSLDHQVFSNYIDMAFASEDYKERTKGYTPVYEILSEKINKDTAYVEIRGKDPLGTANKINVRLILSNNRWKVDGNQGVFNN